MNVYLRYQATYNHLISYHPYSQLQRADVLCSVFVEEFTGFFKCSVMSSGLIFKISWGRKSCLVRYVVSLLQVTVH